MHLDRLYSPAIRDHFRLVNRERLDSWCELGILTLVLGILVFGPLAMGAVEAQYFGVIQFCTVGAAALWICRLWLGEHPQLLWPPICWGVLAFTAYAIGRYLTADIEYVARQELLRVLTYALIFFIIVNNLYRQDSVQLVSLTVVFLGMAISVYAAYQFLSGDNRVWTHASPYKGRAGGTYICPNHLAGLLEMLLPLALAYVVAGRLRQVMKVLVGYAALVMVFGIAVTMSRGGWLAAGAAILLFTGLLFLRRGFRLPALALLAVILVAGGIVVTRSLYFQERFKKAFDENKPTKLEDIRFELWRPAVQMWRDHFWFGAGPAHFDPVFGAYRPQAIQRRPGWVHNDYLNTLADWGVAGFALVAGAWGLLAWGVIKTWGFVRGGARDFGSNQSNKFALVLGASAGLTALLLHSVVDFNMHIPANAILAVTLMALLTAHLRFTTDGYWHTARLWFKCGLTLALLGGIGYVGAQGTRSYQEERWLTRAKQLPLDSHDKLCALEKAFAIEPQNPDTTYALGEYYRMQFWDRGVANYEELAQQAMEWYTRGMKLNRHNPYLPLSYGRCLDWIGRQPEATTYYDLAERLDPNNYFVVFNMGWHYVQTDNYAAAREWFARSVWLEWKDNLIAKRYLEIADRRLAEAAVK